MVYLSTDFKVDLNDREVSRIVHNEKLPGGDTYDVTAQIFIPASFEGNYLLLLNTDRSNQVYEHEAEDNNIIAIPILISQPPPTDFIVTQINAPQNAKPGDVIDINWTVKNIGANSVLLKYKLSFSRIIMKKDAN